MDVKKTKVESLDIIVTMMEDKPYYEIKYKEVGSDHFCIGYSSYRLDYVLEWKKQYFELFEREAGAGQGWIPCKDRLPEESGYYMACVYNKEVNDYDYRKNWFAHKDDYYTDESEWGELMSFERVTAWMPLPEPYKEND